MRVLHIFDHSLPLQSGYVTRSLGIIKAQRALGWDTFHITTPKHGGAAQITETIEGLTFTRTPAVHRMIPVARELAEMRATRRAIQTLARDVQPDILHAHSPLLNAIPAIAVGRSLKIPVVYEIRAFWEDAAVDHGTTSESAARYKITRFLETRAMHRADHLVTLCEPMRREIIARGIADTQISVVPNAVDPFYLDKSGATLSLRNRYGWGDAFVVGFIGSFYAYEGLDLLLEAVLPLARLLPNLKVLLVGGGPEEDRLRKAVNALGLDGRVHFTGRVPQSAVPDYYAAADLLVYPRRKRRLTDLVTPLKPLEAMAQKRPVLASDVGGHRELIADGLTGFLFPADNVGSLVDRIAAISVDRLKLAEVAGRGRRFIESERNWNTVVERYISIYQRARNRRGSHP